MVCADGEQDAERQNQGAAPSLDGPVKSGSEGCAGNPACRGGGLEQGRQSLAVQFCAHQGHGRKAHGAADSGNETGRDRVGDEAHQVGEAKVPDRQAADAGEHGAENERDRCADEQGLPAGVHGRADGGHPDDQCGRQAGNGAAIAAREGDDQAGGETSEQHQPHALGRVVAQGPGEYEGRVGDVGNQKPQTGRHAGGKGGNGPARCDIAAQFAGKTGEYRFHGDARTSGAPSACG